MCAYSQKSRSTRDGYAFVEQMASFASFKYSLGTSKKRMFGSVDRMLAAHSGSANRCLYTPITPT
nr:TPA_asm: m52.5 sORF [Murid betaherpesvirus 1]DBA08001.1 TPA_asm: m52.5 sORF [Murid betaherpesvirus 1]